MAVQRCVSTPKAPGVVSVGQGECWMRMDTTAEVHPFADTYTIHQSVLYRDDYSRESHGGFHFCLFPSCLLQRSQAVMLTMEAAAMVAPHCWTLISVTVPEGWSWERTDAHVRVCMSVCMHVKGR